MKQQIIVGLALAVMTLLYQINTGLIIAPQVDASVLAIAKPYLWLIFLFTLYHIVRTVKKLDAASQQEIGRLREALESTPIPISIAAPPVAPTPTPNVKFDVWRKDTIKYDNYEEAFIQAPTNIRPNKAALLLKIENAPTDSGSVVRGALGLSARLVFKDESDVEISVSPGTWLGYQWGAINLGVPNREWLIVAAIENDGTFIAIGNKRIHSGGTDFYSSEIPDKGTVDIQLVEKGITLTSRTYAYVLTGDFIFKKI